MSQIQVNRSQENVTLAVQLLISQVQVWFFSMHSSMDYNSSSSRKQKLRISLLKTPVAILTRTSRTTPSESGKVSWTNALGLWPRVRFASSMMTKSPTLKFRLCFSHVWRSCNTGRYSLTQRAQNSLAKMCTCFHLAWNLSESSNSLGAEHGFQRDSRMWLGVKASKSLGWHDTRVIGLLFRIFSTSSRKVVKVSSLTRCSSIIAWRILRRERISRSQTPPWWLAAGGLKYYWIVFRSSSLPTLPWYQVFNAFTTSVSAPLKFVPLSL